MTVSLSFTIVNTYAPQGAKPATAVERKTPPVQDDDAGCGNKRPASRQNRLADAMMTALRELGFGGTAVPTATNAAATPAASTTAGSTTNAATASATASTNAAAAADSSASVESAVQQFAHALFQALRQGGSGGKAADEDSGRVADHDRHRHHHRRHGEGQAYGDMAQRLEALSQTVGAPATAAPPAAAATSSSLSLTLTVDAGTADVPAAASTTPAATTVAAPAKNPLLDAFTTLFNALRPVTTPATDMAEKLRLFLHTLAQAVAPDAMGSVQHAQVGGLVNVTA